MRRLLNIALLTCLPLGVIAEPVNLPHTFTPSTPAKASEVNANLDALATAIGNLKRTNLYVGGSKMGNSILANLIKLNSGYVVLLSKKKGNADVFLASGMNRLFFTGSNGTGTAYIDRGLTEDLLSGELGFLAGFRNQAYYINTPATPTTISVNSFWDRDAAQYVSIAGYTANAACGTLQDAGGTTRNVRCNRVTFTLGGCQGSFWDPATGQPKNNGDTVVVTQRYDRTTYPTYDTVMSQCPSSVITSGSVINPEVRTKTLDATGYVVNAYALTPNDSGVTGITTRACVDHKNRPAVCLPTNAQLVSE